MWRSLPHEHQCMIFADCRRLCIKVGRGQGDGDIGTRVWRLGTWGSDIKYGTRGRGDGDTGTKRTRDVNDYRKSRR